MLSLQVIPLQPGSLTMAVYDLCLAFLGPAATYLHVSDIYELEVDLVDKVRQSSGDRSIGKNIARWDVIFLVVLVSVYVTLSRLCGTYFFAERKECFDIYTVLF